MNDNSLPDKLSDRMRKILIETSGVSDVEAEEIAVKEQVNMELHVKNENRRHVLKSRVVSVLQAISPEFEKAVYQAFFERTSEDIVRGFEKYSTREGRQNIEQSYQELEKNLLLKFITSVPRSTGTTSARANDLVDILFGRISHEIGLDLSANDKAGLVDALRTALRIYAGFAKIGLVAEAKVKYEDAEVQVLRNLMRLLSTTKTDASEMQLTKRLEDLLRMAELDLEEHQERSIRNQILWLFRDYVEAPADKRDDIYRQGEDRIVLSLFDSHYLKEFRSIGAR